MRQLRACVDVPASPGGPAVARRVVGALLPAWELADLTYDAQIVVSELVTNAVNHAPGTDTFELELVRLDSGLRIALADGSAIRPVIGDLQHHQAGGRGMMIIAAIATRWGADDHCDGKRVWVDIERSGVDEVTVTGADAPSADAGRDSHGSGFDDLDPNADRVQFRLSAAQSVASSMSSIVVTRLGSSGTPASGSSPVASL